MLNLKPAPFETLGVCALQQNARSGNAAAEARAICLIYEESGHLKSRRLRRAAARLLAEMSALAPYPVMTPMMNAAATIKDTENRSIPANALQGCSVPRGPPMGPTPRG